MVSAFGAYLAYAAPPASEAEVKAAFVYNFCKFTDWPGEIPAEFLICLVGGNEIAPFNMLEGKSVRNAIVRTQTALDFAALGACKAAFISASERQRMPQLLQYLTAKNILTISDMAGFAEAGGMFELLNSGGRMRFNINLDAILQAKLKVSSQLIGLANRVIGGKK